MTGRRAGPAMEFQSDRLRMLGGRLTARVMEAAVARVIDGAKIPEDFEDGERKAALIVVRELNPDEILFAHEEAIVRGKDIKTLRAMKEAREILAVLGGRQ